MKCVNSQVLRPVIKVVVSSNYEDASSSLIYMRRNKQVRQYWVGKVAQCESQFGWHPNPKNLCCIKWLYRRSMTTVNTCKAMIHVGLVFPLRAWLYGNIKCEDFHFFFFFSFVFAYCSLIVFFFAKVCCTVKIQVQQQELLWFFSV